MNAQQGLAWYRRLFWLYPRAWRERHEQEFLETLTVASNAGNTNMLVQLIDLCGLALMLRQRQLRDYLSTLGRRLVGSTPPSRTGLTPSTSSTAPPELISPASGVIGLAMLLIVGVVQWGGQIPIEFVLTSSLVVLVPGIGVFYTVSSAIAGGRDRGITAATGCTLGIVPHLVVALLGLSGIMQLGAGVFETVRWAGVAYLAWMGVGMFRQRGSFQFSVDNDSEQSSPGITAGTVIGRGILLNMLNPKLTLFFFAFLPQFLTNSAGGTGDTVIDMQLVGLSCLFMFLTLACFVLYALIGASLSRWVERSPSALSLIQRSFGVLLIGFAAHLAVAER